MLDPFILYADITIARSLVNHTLDFICFGRHGRSKAVCCDDLKGEGKEVTEGFARARLTIHTDYVRPRSASPTISSSSARLDSQPLEYLS